MLSVYRLGFGGADFALDTAEAAVGVDDRDGAPLAEEPLIVVAWGFPQIGTAGAE